MKTPKQKRTNENCPPEPDCYESADDDLGDTEHDEQAFYRDLARGKRVDGDGGLPGFAPAGIKGSDSDQVVVRKWQAYTRSPKCEHTGLPPKRVLMAMIRQDGGDRRLAGLGLNSYQIAEFNRGHITMEVLLAIEGGTDPGHDQEKVLARAIREYRDVTKQMGYFQSFLAAGRLEQQRQKRWRKPKFSPGPFLEVAEYEAKVKLFLERGLSKQQMLREIRKANQDMKKEELSSKLKEIEAYWDENKKSLLVDLAAPLFFDALNRGDAKEEMIRAMEEFLKAHDPEIDNKTLAGMLKNWSQTWDFRKEEEEEEKRKKMAE